MFLALVQTACDKPSTQAAQPAEMPRQLPLATTEPSAATSRALHFTDITPQTGIDMTLTSGRSPSTQILEVNGGGLALVDFDNDGDLDLFIANGATMENPEHGPGCRLYENVTGSDHAESDLPNESSIRFRDITHQAKINITRWAMGVTAGDYDGDGFDDLYISCYGPNVLLRNNGDGTFEDATGRAGVGDDRWAASAAWGDVDNDGDLDLYVTNYLFFDPKNPPPPGRFKGVDVLNGPHNLTPQADVLYENLGDGTFRDITVASGCAAARPSFGLNAIIIDLDRDGWQDIVVANDSMPGFLFRNNGAPGGEASRDQDIEGERSDASASTPHFEEIGVISGLAHNADGGNQAAMGVAFADVDGNGLPDKFTTVFSSDTNALHLNINGTLFEDRAQQYGLAAISRPYLGWATHFCDFDHDGDEDLLLFNGHVYPNASMELMDSEYEQPPLLFERDGKRFKRVKPESAGEWLGWKRRHRCAAWGDLDNDGDIDMVVGELNGPVRILRNDAIGPDEAIQSPLMDWLIVSISDNRPHSKNRRGIGAVIEHVCGDHTQTRWLYSGGSFQSSNAPYVHFGIPGEWRAADTSSSLKITWPAPAPGAPGGVEQRIDDVSLGQHMIIAHPQ